MKLFFHATVICAFATMGANAFAQQRRIEIQTRFVEFPMEQRGQPPDSLATSAPEAARGAITYSALDALFAPMKMKADVSLPKDAAELAGQLEKAGDNAMCYKTPMELAGVVTMAQEQAVERLFMNKGLDVWKTGSTAIDSGGKAQVGLTHKTGFAFGTREVGETADLTVVIGADGETMDLTMNPRSIGLLGWLSKGEDGKPVFAPVSKKASSKNEEAVFSEGAAEKPLTVSIWDGQTVMVKGEKLELVAGAQGEKPKLVCKGVIMMITARLVDTSTEAR